MKLEKSVPTLLTAAMLLAGAASGCLITYDPDDVELAQTDTTPRLAIVSPSANEVVADCLRLRVNFFNLTLVDPASHPENVEGQGHYHIDIDSSPIPGDLSLTGPGADIPLRSLGFTQNTEHTVTVRTHNNDHTPHDVIQSARVTWVAGWDGDTSSPTAGRCVVNEGTGGGL